MSDDALEIRADSIDDAELEDVWIAGMPLGRVIDNAEVNSKRALSQLGDRPQRFQADEEDGEAAELWALVDQLSAEVSRLQEKIAPDTDGKDHEQLTRTEKVHETQMAALEDAQSSPRRKAALTYREVKMLFDGKPSTGHC